mmetsp:Transcript_1752/g.3810  ORF Transcript_1752/g.3810 Transcript_1752/m.3810 type:complete len:715 (+) Transcript_1752:113-2257(+)|eukprot:CAMPEP_0168293030 /NCGR_PEP_ID=MMETSP0142_2-20121227/7597_1 /TAXON_ID=44445 /ORGANISM="Pseudo-nitzschia australis, Strain 10249 10 AB" /LENGTH=714 /DNA_ID=CAMNT_0008241007 /DNA_START=84 /DNA_END=2228 /DNA_ORIENTATION=-
MSSNSRADDTVFEKEQEDFPCDREVSSEVGRNENGDVIASAPLKSLPVKDKRGHHCEQSDPSTNQSIDTCPICFNPTKEFVSGSCRHSLCAECMELVLNANAAVERWPPPAAADTHLSAPTLGRCPICRSTLSLFDIVNSKTLEHMYPPDTESWKPQEEKDQHDQQQHPVGDIANNVLSSVTQSLASSLIVSTRTHPLENAVYIPYRGRPGELSFHWDWKRLKPHDKEDKITPLPFLNLTLAIQRRPQFWRLEDQTIAPRITFMEEGCHFHEPSRTFHGTVLWPVPLKGSYEWDIILGFSKDYRFISSGRIHHKRGRILKQGDTPKTYTNEERELCKYPMDGRWTVVWKNQLGEEQRNEIHVINNEFKQSRWSFYFNFQDPSRVFVQWPRSKHRQTIVAGVDLIQQPLGPPTGHRIQWETSDPNAPDLVWIRQTIGPVPTEKVHHYGMGENKFFYQRLHAEMRDSIPKYNGSSVWGNVFTKRMCIGSASYHFLSPTDSYISYRHPACRDLPPMDDGSPLPMRVNFHNIEWIQGERKLTASIEWEEDFGTSWNDNVRWKLTMYFDAEFMIILKGGIQVEWSREYRARPRPPRPQPRHRPAPVPVYVPPSTPEENKETEEDRNEEWIVSGFGHDQIYVNAASLERYRTEEGRSRGDGLDFLREETEDNEVDYQGIAELHHKRLEKEGATKRSIGFLSHLFELAAENPNTNPIDFLL